MSHVRLLPPPMFDWRREELLDELSASLNQASGVDIEKCRADYETLSTEALEETRRRVDSDKAVLHR